MRAAYQTMIIISQRVVPLGTLESRALDTRERTTATHPFEETSGLMFYISTKGHTV
jgi:hypothetical protein